MDWVLFWTVIGVGISIIGVAFSLGAAFWRRIIVSEHKAETIENRIEQKIDAYRAEVGTWIQMLTISNQDLTTRVSRLEGRLKGGNH